MNTSRRVVVCGCAGWVLTGCAAQGPSPFARPGDDSRIEIRPEAVAASQDAPEPRITWTTHYRAARYHESTGNYSEALLQYNKALAAKPNNATVYNRLGILYGMLNKHAEAEAALQKAITLRPDDAVTRNNLGFQYILEEKWPDAERELRRAILMDPNLDRARVNLGVALAAQGEYDEALKEFRRVLPETDALYNLGLAYRTRRRFEDAQRTFRRVLELNPKFEAARQQLAFLERRASKAAATPSGVGETAGAARDDTAALTISQLTTPVPRSDFESGAGSEPASPLKTSTLESPTTNVAAPNAGGTASLGDFDGDGDIDLSDFARFQTCLSQRSTGHTPSCAAGDFDRDGDIDLDDYQRFQSVLSGASP